ncbi:hypothetical protein AA0113_g5147 [Alternaria arborescens]|uniref:Uncharacterized protein n=1 Tax=Alternaria arborescens TaxID=156630 RepID=A0A4Q4SBG9_9PLEO|nr:hypothetical protein AA0113_g5147 [Alternaria arborescens]
MAATTPFWVPLPAFWGPFTGIDKGIFATTITGSLTTTTELCYLKPQALGFLGAAIISC